MPDLAWACATSEFEIVSMNALYWISIVIGPLSLLTYIILFITSNKKDVNQKFRWLRRLALILFILSLIIFVYIRITSGFLCASSEF